MDRGPIHFSRLKYPHLANARTRSHSRQTRPELAPHLADARVALILALGFSAGLPLLLVFGTLSAWLRESGVPVTTIGLFSWLALAYSLKFLWSPFVDAFDVPVLSQLVGRRARVDDGSARSWWRSRW